MRERFLVRYDDYKPTQDIYIVGVNELTKENVRKILWIGKLSRVMTFEVASKLLKDPGFQSLVDVRTEKEPDKNNSPLHVEPAEMMGKLLGYKHRTHHHNKIDKQGVPEWVKDIISSNDRGLFSYNDSELLFAQVTNRRMALKHDCCFLCEKVFFAQGHGMPISPELVKILDGVQPGQGVDEVAIFGYKQDLKGRKVVGPLKGTHLHVKFRHADQIVGCLLRSISG